MAFRFSVVVNTINRASSLRQTLKALSQLDYEQFEVVVVNGPSTDDTHAVLSEFADRIKIGSCANHNLSESRNIGIAMAAGDLVAFIDDDAYPDPGWLDSLAAAFDNEEVAAAGGPVYDYTGVSFQAKYSFASRFGGAWVGGDGTHMAECNVPFSPIIPYVIGTNSSFRRDRLVSIGGFDEEFEYYLDETDVCCRLVDEGYYIAQLDEGFVYHKFLPSAYRASNRAINNRYPVLKSRCYFALKHGLRTSSFYDVCRSLAASIEDDQGDWIWMLENDLVSPTEYERWLADIPLAFDAGFDSYRNGRNRTRPPEWFSERQEPFKPFPRLRSAAEKLHLCFFTQEYPPQQLNGISRVIHTLATGLAGRGHVVDVLTAAVADHSTVDLEEGVWVHRIVVADHEPPLAPDVPSRIWSYSASLFDELVRIADIRPIDIVQAPNWDSEGVAVVADGRFTTVVGLYTPIKIVATIDDNILQAGGATDPFVRTLIELEAWMYRHADGFLACGPEIVEEIENEYALCLSGSEIGFVAHGLPDISATSPSSGSSGSELRVLFVGRLERRKGIDVLLESIPALVEEFPSMRFLIVGNDEIPGPDGIPYRRSFEASATKEQAEQVEFRGIVSDIELSDLYSTCDIFVAPSRFESFGLIFVEAMMKGKPVIGCEVGGVPSVVSHGENGFLVPPGDVSALQHCIARLARDPDLRRKFGLRSRSLYETRFSAERMSEEAERFYRRLAGRRRDPSDLSVRDPRTAV